MKRLAFFAALAAVCAIAAAVLTGCGPPECCKGDESLFNIKPATLDASEQSYLLSVARGEIYGSKVEPDQAKYPNVFKSERRPIVVSLALNELPALVAHGDSENPYESVRDACATILRLSQMRPINDGWIRIDVVDTTGPPNKWNRVGKFKFDRESEGIAFNLRPVVIFTPSEIISRLLFSAEKANPNNLMKYIRNERVYGDLVVDCLGLEKNADPAGKGVDYTNFTLLAFSEAPGRPAELVQYNGLQPADMPVSKESLKSACVAAGDYLCNVIDDAGGFVNRYRPQVDKDETSTDSLTLAEASISLIAIGEVTGDERPAKKASTCIDRLIERSTPAQVNGVSCKGVAEAAVKTGSRGGRAVSLDATAATIIAICDYARIFGDRGRVPAATEMAEYILASQAEDGGFIFGSRPVDKPGRLILALLRLHQIAPDPRFLDSSARGIDRILGSIDPRSLDDFWSIVAINEMYSISRRPDYKDFVEAWADSTAAGQDRYLARPDVRGPFQPKAEPGRAGRDGVGLASAYRLTAFAGGDESDVAGLDEALGILASFLLRCQFNRYDALHMTYPMKALGGFHKAPDDYDVEIDTTSAGVLCLAELYQIMKFEEMAGGEPGMREQIQGGK